MKNKLKSNRSLLYAKILAGINSVIAIPALCGTAVSVILFIMLLGDSNSGIYPYVFCFCIWLVTLIGLILLTGYWYHACGRLSSAKTKSLWKGTFIFNFFLSVSILIIFWLAFGDGNKDLSFFVFLTFNFFYCVATMILSILGHRETV